MPAAAAHPSIRALTPAGTVTVRTRLPLPTKSGSTQRASRCCRSPVEPQQFGPAQAAADEQGKDGPVALAGQGLWIGGVEQIVGLFFGQPVP